MSKFVRVFISHHYIVPADNSEAIEYAKEALADNLSENFQELFQNINVEDAPEADESDIPDFILEYIEELNS